MGVAAGEALVALHTFFGMVLGRSADGKVVPASGSPPTPPRFLQSVVTEGSAGAAGTVTTLRRRSGGIQICLVKTCNIIYLTHGGHVSEHCAVYI